MQVWNSVTCLKYGRDEKLPADWMCVAKNTCLSCIHSLKVRNPANGDIDIVPCGSPEPNRQLGVAP